LAVFSEHLFGWVMNLKRRVCSRNSPKRALNDCRKLDVLASGDQRYFDAKVAWCVSKCRFTFDRFIDAIFSLQSRHNAEPALSTKANSPTSWISEGFGGQTKNSEPFTHCPAKVDKFDFDSLPQLDQETARFSNPKQLEEERQHAQGCQINSKLDISWSIISLQMLLVR
ncbi:hypothetical protein XENOCAPTIV_011586, partial [Xenoophorus captivus]